MDLKLWGPLRHLIGNWEGDKGVDIAPSDDRKIEENRFRELVKFEAIGPVTNHEQILYGLRYSTTAWRLNETDPFHEELGYWMWDGKASQVMRCFMVPRGVTILAGGTVKIDAKEFELKAQTGSGTYGICSNPYLSQEFETVSYQLNVRGLSSQSFEYEEDTVLKIKGTQKLFHHTDKNLLLKSVNK